MFALLFQIYLQMMFTHEFLLHAIKRFVFKTSEHDLENGHGWCHSIKWDDVIA